MYQKRTRAHKLTCSKALECDRFIFFCLLLEWVEMMDAWYTNELSPNAASKQQTYCWNIHTHVYIENFPGLSQHTFPQAAHVHMHVHVIAHTCLTSALRLLRSAWAIRERMRECSSTHSIDFWSTGEENYDRPTHVNKKKTWDSWAQVFMGGACIIRDFGRHHLRSIFQYSASG